MYNLIDFYNLNEPICNFGLTLNDLLFIEEEVFKGGRNTVYPYKKSFRLITLWLGEFDILNKYLLTKEIILKTNLHQELDNLIKWYCKQLCK